MSFLLQFFLKHQCINHNLILQWYNNNDTHGYKGFEEAKRLAGPFIKLLSTSNTHNTLVLISIIFFSEFYASKFNLNYIAISNQNEYILKY